MPWHSTIKQFQSIWFCATCKINSRCDFSSHSHVARKAISRAQHDPSGDFSSFLPSKMFHFTHGASVAQARIDSTARHCMKINLSVEWMCNDENGRRNRRCEFGMPGNDRRKWTCRIIWRLFITRSIFIANSIYLLLRALLFIANFTSINAD